MATVVLQTAGAVLGGLLGPFGSALGRAAGALAGYALDRAVIDGTRHIEGPRLNSARPFTAEEGAPLPRAYGTVRMGGTMIWATRFEESRQTERRGFKGGPRVTEYSYFANVAFALCEGRIAGIRRVWADGRELDRTTLELRVYQGSEDQEPDPLIEAKQGEGNAPAYRGVAYVVIERLALAEYGNRVPQFQFEVLRPVGSLCERVRAVTLIPGATEYGLQPTLVTRRLQPGETVAENRHVLHAGTDIAAALDELQALCPNLERVALVATWFGDDLRAGHCRIRPAVTTASADGLSSPWMVSGLDRATAPVVSTHDGGAAYGGSPSDRSVMDAIAEIRARGLEVALYPFVMMDIAGGNGLPDPHGAAEQAAYPWRGRISCHPGPMQPGSADGTAAARTQVAAFCGDAEPEDFDSGDETIAFSGDADDWGYRRFVLHFAHLAEAAGGVDSFLIGSELRGLTTLRDDASAFPFVEALCTLAGEVKGILGGGTSVTYGADWSEYFGHHPADGSGDVLFHLDALWSHAAIDAVGIDNYMPLADWRDGDEAGASPDGFGGPHDPAGLAASIAAGEGFDWYYASTEARAARARTPISDGAYAKPWTFRYKDLVGWWSNPHVDRIGGVEAGAPTGWVPQSKPIWFTELGCPAVERGPNQPNVFPDPKSSEHALPHFSNGGRSDIAQQRFLAAHLGHWDPAGEDFDPANNPLSGVYGGRMVDPGAIYLWAWDARPFPAFPQRTDRWSDSRNWHRGHWLNGRLGSPGLGDLCNAILADLGLPAADADGCDGSVQGYVATDPTSARAALEPLADLFGIAAFETPEGLVLRSVGSGAADVPEITELVCEDEGAVIEAVHHAAGDEPDQAVLAFSDPFRDYQAASVRSVHAPGGGRLQTLSFAGTLETGQAQALLDAWMQRRWCDREILRFAVGEPRDDLAPGAVVRLAGRDGEYEVTEIEDGLARTVAARRLTRFTPPPWRDGGTAEPLPAPIHVGTPHFMLLDLPMVTAGEAPQDRFRVAVWQRPWRSQVILASPEDSGFAHRATATLPARCGRLAAPLDAGVTGRIDRSTALDVNMFGGEPASVSRLQLLNGANAAAVRTPGGTWEVLQFETAEEISPGLWRLTGLLRGQLGTDDAMAAGAETGADFVLLDAAVQPAGLRAGEVGLLLNWRVGAADAEVSGTGYATASATGGVRALTPLSPVHLRVEPAGGDLRLSWTRRGRFDADGWGAGDIPLGEDGEEYRVEIAPAGGPVVRTVDVPEPAWTYAAAEIAADFPVAPAEIDVTVRQRGGPEGWGISARERFGLG